MIEKLIFIGCHEAEHALIDAWVPDTVVELK